MTKLAQLLCIGIFFLIVPLAWPTQTVAQTLVFEDDFETDLEKWQAVRDDGQYWQIVEGTVEAYLPWGNTVTELIPKDEYWDEQWQDLAFSFELTPLEGTDKNTLFGFLDPNNWYEFHFTGRTLNLVRLKDGWAPFNIFSSHYLPNGHTYHFRIEFEQGVIRLFIDNQLIIEKEDWTFDEKSYGKIGLRATTGSVFPTRLRYDNVSVELLSRTEPIHNQLQVPHFFQTDALWNNLEYDSANQWSNNPTMARWGCLTTSLAMVLHYYGIHQLPIDGDLTQLTPATLNTWLQNQVDGYVGQGLVNWLAVTRLTQQMSQKLDSPKLEYSYRAGTSFSTSLQQIALGQPSILQIPEHFLVTVGFIGQNNQIDLLINDPFYPFKKLGQHDTSLISTRVLTPSQTDLSYLMVVHDSEVRATFLNEENKPINEQFTSSETIVPPNSSNEIISQNMSMLAKPDPGYYSLQITGPLGKTKQVELYAYTQTGEVSVHKQTVTFTNQPLKWHIDFDKQEKRNWVSSYSPSDAIASIDDLYQKKYLSRHLYLRLKRIFRVLKRLPNHLLVQYYYLIERYLHIYSSQIHPEALQTIKQVLIQLRDGKSN